ncbi:hypothetical protein FHS27_004805 [Rhodopirellula rubra]|uniref:Uncharacterized protein n=1 Tax=Aporhodopirellula rubra TaxID=980271 RepID=A0A7W5H8F9_9BACT|nr:hypothetical protein [Aporhodopirellula rubra]
MQAYACLDQQPEVITCRMIGPGTFDPAWHQVCRRGLGADG